MSEPGPGSCRASGPTGFVAATVTSGEHQRFAGFALYVDALYRGYDLAMARLTAEAVALGADGVVGVRLEVERHGFARQFSAVGTAVRAAGPVRPPTPFVTDLDAGQLTALLLGGWVPVSLVIGLSVSVRHEDPATSQQRRRTNRVNAEIDAATDLVQRTREDARKQFTARDAGRGGQPCNRHVGVPGRARRRRRASRHDRRGPGVRLDHHPVRRCGGRAARRAAGAPGRSMKPYSSALSVDEFLLIRESGYRPAGLVVGSAVVKLGRRARPRPVRVAHELKGWTQPLLLARVSAVARLRAEAKLLGAVGVIGVDVALVHKGFRGSVVEVVATGTAVAGPPLGDVFTCVLPGQEFWSVLQAGRAPLGVVQGAAAFYQTLAPTTAYSPRLNDENPWRTEGVYRARDLAMRQMLDTARLLGAAATIGVSVQQTFHRQASNYGSVSEFVVFGTAVRDLPERPTVPVPLRMLPLTT